MKPVEEIARDPLADAEAWDRCYPGNVNFETMVDRLVAALRAERGRAERAEAERDEAREFAAISDERHGQLLRQSMRDHDARVAAESALATARNRALEEAAGVAGEELTAYDEEGNDGEVWVVRKIVDAILSLRTKEPTDAK